MKISIIADGQKKQRIRMKKNRKNEDISEQNIWIYYVELRQIVSSENLGYS